MADRMHEGAVPRVVVVGCGVWGRHHVRNYAELGALAGIVDQDAGTATDLANSHGVPAMTFEQALGDETVAALVFALPPSWNHSLGTRALEAGKHLFVEKPMALTSHEGDELRRLADRFDRRLMVGHILQYHPAFEALLAIVRGGQLGRISSVVSTRLDFGRIRREEDALWALAPHDVSMVLALAGDEPVLVSARGSFLTHSAIADLTDLHLEFAGGMTAEIRSSWLHPFKEQRLAVIGEGGMAVFDDREPWAGKLVVYPHRFEDRSGVPFAIRAEPEPVALDAREPLRAECLHFLDCVRTGRRPVSDGDEGLRVLHVLERASVSLACEPASA